jgi:O-succinylbenzoic acid--CoA ligase
MSGNLTGSTLGTTLSVFDAARDEPARLGLVTDTVTLTFAELATRVERRLSALSAAGLLDPNGERPVSFDAHPSLEVLETVLALLHAGTTFIPLHPRLTEPEKQLLEARAGAVRVTPTDLATPPSPGAIPAWSDPERIAALVATSGSTGTPRLARLSHRALLAGAHASAAHLGTEDDDRALLALPLAHVGGLMTFVRSLVGRRPLVMFDPGVSLLARLPALSRALVEHRVTQLSLVPTLLDRLLAPDTGFVAGSLRVVLLGGAACSRALLLRAHERELPVLTTYGLTEACAQVATRRYAERYDPPPPEGAPLTIGVALPGVGLRSIDGVVEIGGPTLFSGYAGDPTSDPTGGWFRTGDRGDITPEGELVLRGRVSDVIITGGENVDPVEVEAALETLPGVREACVFGLRDATFGETIAIVFVPNGAPPKPEELLAELQDRLARYKLPRRWLAVPELPRLPSGKLDRRGARERYATLVAGMPALVSRRT